MNATTRCWSSRYGLGMEPDVSVTREIAAPADRVWAMISDLPRMGEWSPENEGGEWLQGATGPAPGATFRGHNRNGSKAWTMLVTIIDVEPGRRLSFRTSWMKAPSAEWSYEIEPTDTGCRITESWTDKRWRWGLPISGWISGVTDRTPHTRAGIEETLANLAVAAEAEPDAG